MVAERPCLSVTMNEHHLGAVFEDQVSDPTVGQSDAHQVLTLQRQNLHKQKHQHVNYNRHGSPQYRAQLIPSHVHPDQMELTLPCGIKAFKKVTI